MSGHHVHTVFVTYNRLHLTMQAVESYLATVSLPHTYLVVDNASSDGTVEWLCLPRFDKPAVFAEMERVLVAGGRIGNT